MLDVLNNKNQEEMNEKNKLIYSLIDNLKTVKFANAAFLKGRILDSFKKYLKLYKAGIEKLKSAQQINGWVKKATKGLIKKIMEEISPLTFMILINAIYFKGKWEKPFNKSLTEKKDFINFKKEKQLIDFMYQNNEFKYFEDKEIQAISLNYIDDKMEAIIILPKHNYDINNYIHQLNQKKFNEIVGSFCRTEVKLYLPKFKIEFERELKDIFIN